MRCRCSRSTRSYLVRVRVRVRVRWRCSRSRRSGMYILLVRDARQLGERVQRQRAQRAEHLARVRVRVRVGLGLGLGLGFRVLDLKGLLEDSLGLAVLF